MSFKGLIRELKEIKEGIGSLSRRGSERRNWRNRAKSHIAPDEVPHSGYVQQSRWAYLPPELLLDIIRRVEESETMWPARNVVVFCASVCKTWREVTKEIVKTPEECGRVTFPISLKQPGPRELPIQCFIRRDRATSTYFLHIGLTPSENESDKLLLAARKIRRATCTDFVISLVSNEFSRANDTYVGKLRSNFLGTKFTIYDSQPPAYGAVNKCSSHTIKKLHSRQVSPRLPACNYSIAYITYELNVLRTRGPRRIHCVMHSVPFSSVEEGGTAPTPSSFQQSFDESFSELLVPPSEKEPVINYSSTSLHSTMTPMQGSGGPLILKNKAPRWHEQLQCWCLNFRGRVTVASVKNFQLVAAVDSSHNVVEEEKERVILQFGKIGKDIFTMDYRYPLSAFQAFAICLSSFDTKPACE